MRYSGPRLGVRALAVSLLLLASAASAAAEAPLRTYYFMVFANPIAGMDAEFNRWYDEVHALEVIAGPDFVSAQRFALSDVQLGSGAAKDKADLPRYMILYVVRTRDIAGVLAEMRQRLKTSPTNISSPSFDMSSLFSYTFTPAAEVISAADVRARRARQGLNR
jgi:hypothetical protein